MAAPLPDCNAELCRYADKIPRGPPWRNAKRCWMIRLQLATGGYAEIGLQCCPILTETNKSHRASLFGERSPYLQYHHAPPAVIGD
jgi:hypothetical protein